MPTYSYACTECDNRFDAVQAFTEDTLTTCPECSGRLRKLFNSVGVVFKGSGFYRTDSRESGKKTGSGESGSGSSGSGSSGSGSSGSEKSGGDSSSSSSTSSSTPSSTPSSPSTGSSAPATTSS